MTDNQAGWPVRLLLGFLLSTMALWLGYLVINLESASTDLVASVLTNLGASGVSNPVTAVLLNFRGYDTLLEMGVLLLALLGVWSLGSVRQPPEPPPGPVLVHMPQVLVPLLVLVAGYLLWAGGQAPGGAFQAGSVLGAAGVLMLLAGWRIDDNIPAMALRLMLALGLGLFVTMATIPVFSAGAFLQYPPARAGLWILLIESAATLSIAVTLALLFLGGLPGSGQR